MSELRIRPAGPLHGVLGVPGDKSIAHRLLILGALAEGGSEIEGLPASEDVRSTAACLSILTPELRPELHAWDSNLGVRPEGGGFTSDGPRPRPSMRLVSSGRRALEAPTADLPCGNSGTTMRLLMGVLAAVPGSASLVGDASLSVRPMERVARPLRSMGAGVETTDGHAPVHVRGGRLRGIRHEAEVPSAQVKGAILLAGLAAEGPTEVVEGVPTRDHTERMLAALGVVPTIAPRVEAAAIPAFRAAVPGDISGAAFLAAAALASGGSVRVAGVGLNPTRIGFVDVLRSMGALVEVEVEASSLGEPGGALEVRSGGGLRGVEVAPDEVPALIDEVPALALLAALAEGPSRFRGIGELRVKESDRVAAIVRAVRDLGGDAAAEGDDLVIAGGGLSGGTVDPRGDHRIAMAAAAGAIGAAGPSVVMDAACAAVSFPGFASALRHAGADVEG